MISVVMYQIRHTILWLALIGIFSRYSLVSAQSGDGGGSSAVPDGDPGSDPSADAGASGPDNGSVNLSKGATIAIAVIVGVVIILGVTSAVLFFLAKRRQWQVRASLRKSVKRVGTAIKTVTTPRTPHKMTFSPIEGSGSEKRFPKKDQTRKQPTEATSEKSRSLSQDRDLEKGYTQASTAQRKATIKKPRPALPKVDVSKSAFDMDSPKTPMWVKVFGR